MSLTHHRNESHPLRRLGGLCSSARNIITLDARAQDFLHREIKTMLEAAREAGAEAGRWNLPDRFVAGIEARLRSLVWIVPEAVEVDTPVLTAEAVSVRNELQELDAWLRATESDSAPHPPFRSTATLGLAGICLATFVALDFHGVPVWTTLLICTALFACGVPLIHAGTRWAGWLQRFQAKRRMHQLRKELAALDSEIRCALRSRAQLDTWVAQWQQTLEDEYWRFRALAARAADPGALPNDLCSHSRSLPHRGLNGILPAAYQATEASQ